MIDVARGMTMGRVAAVINDLETQIRRAIPAARYIFIEPDLRRAEVAAEER